MTSSPILSTGLTRCYNQNGESIDCRGSGQDGEFLTGIGWPAKRFEQVSNYLVRDMATGLIWSKNSCPSEYPLNWQEGLSFIEQVNKEELYGRNDWRMPNRRELRSLIDHSAKNPALTAGHPFDNIFLGWYWTSTTAAIAPRYAWHVHLEGGRMFYGNKDGYYWVWPVCGPDNSLPCTGAADCYDPQGEIIPCAESRQDASLNMGIPWPKPRFLRSNFGHVDALTGLTWHPKAILGRTVTTWADALFAVKAHAKKSSLPWRMPTINELESLVDASTHSPALPGEHPFSDVQESYWSSTTSTFEPDWAYVLYLQKGAVGVGYKKNSDFALWPVMSMA